MSEKRKISRQDPGQIVKSEHDVDFEAKRTVIVGGEMAIELSHSDGDSVYSVPKHMHMKGKGEWDVSEYREVWIYGGFADVSPHPTDNVWIEASSGPICACRIKSDSDDIYIVVRS